MASQIRLSPAEIRFIHDNICRKFKNGRSVNDTIDQIAKGCMSVEELPKIAVIKKDGYYYSLDNRRLYVYRVLHYRGLLENVIVNHVSSSLFQPEKFTTINNGNSIFVRRDVTKPHCQQDQ